MRENVRILVLSISAWNSKVGLNTWPTLLEGHNPQSVANICLREEIPDSPVCENYFVISENKVMKSLFHRKTITGFQVRREDSNIFLKKDLLAHNTRYNKMKRRGRPLLALIARELIWKCGKWKTRDLDRFIEEFNPNIILYSMDGYIHFNRICRYVKKKTGVKSIGFFVDDNFTYKQSNSFKYKMFRFFQRKSLKKLAGETDSFFAITKKTKKEADAYFGVNCVLLTKPLNRTPIYIEKEITEPIRIIYTGNLLIGRDTSLIKVVNALKKINVDKTYYVIDVYTATQLSDKVLEQLECEFCKIHPPVSQSKVFELQEQADILLFLEDVEGPDSKTARLSFSTKITDYLSNGKCIFAVGCMETAPMEYFDENDSAIIATNEEQMVKKFSSILCDKSIINKYAFKACDCGIRNHKKEEILEIFNETIENVL